VGTRCAKLAIECVQGCNDKLPVMTQWLKQRGIKAANTVYLGNDVTDLECLAAVGCGIAVADAHAEARAAARIVLSRPGGHGAVRELCDLILKGTSR
jgi:YrbI family 3-deoxy-D-manno-octulosonate 8-phosphate phosphatase